MAHTFYRARPVGLSARTAYTFGGLVDRLNAWNDARRTRNALSQLTAHELADIGIELGDIDRISVSRR